VTWPSWLKWDGEARVGREQAGLEVLGVVEDHGWVSVDGNDGGCGMSVRMSEQRIPNDVWKNVCGGRSEAVRALGMANDRVMGTKMYVGVCWVCLGLWKVLWDVWR
jgi:hypothetical protein